MRSYGAAMSSEPVNEPDSQPVSQPVDQIGAPSWTVVPWTLRDAGWGIAVVAAVLVLSFAGARVVDMSGYPLLAIALVGGGLEAVLLVVVWRLGPWRYGHSWGSLGLARTFNGGASLALAVFLASVGFSILYAFAVWLLGLDAMSPTQLPAELLDTFTQRIVLFGLIVVLAPFAEEVFFRGFLLPAFSARWGFLWGAVGVSALFGIVHGVGSLIPAFASGMLLAWLYRRTRSLWNCCLAHGVQNALAFTVAVSI